MSKKLSTLGVGATFEVPVKSAYRSFLGDYVVFKMADKNHSGYPSGAITLITDKIIALLCSDAKEPNNSDSNRRSYGNNRHIHSNILQWLNSNAAAGKWYSAKHGQDAPPSSANVWDNVNPYDTWAGFLHRKNVPCKHNGSRACKRKRDCRGFKAGLVQRQHKPPCLLYASGH